MTTASGSFSAVGVSAIAACPADGELVYSITGPFVAKVIIERALAGGVSAWLPVFGAIAPASGVVTGRAGENYRLRVIGYTSGTVTYSLAPAAHIAPTLMDGLVLANDLTVGGLIQATLLINAANDAAAQSAGVAIGQFYRNGSIVMQRVA